ncbi:protein with unknown function [Ricinus communis]|uniref:non-specific serine/threonine protein kinase n=1 Tax=Ricinus communis TaxID=3988 RepID=B9T525_RICCO|nr:protein with unknown function [Ricinus communis]
MSISRTCTFCAVLLMWLCWSPSLIGAQDAITSPIEVKALREVKKSLVDINKNLSNWNRGDPCTSNWTGVLCFNATMDDGYLHVRELQLLNMNLSGTLSPSLGLFSYMKILDFMWNNITGSIPKEIGDIKSLELLLLNGNQLTGPLPDELGYLPNLDRIQVDQNHISGSIPTSFAYLNKTKHFHMNNNSINGQIPPELSRLPMLVHFLLDNNNLSGYLPPQFSELPNLLILQLDNNQFDGGTIPDSYGNMTKLLKLSLRNCSLRGPIPDLSRIPNLGYLDLSSNQLNGTIPPGRLSENITTIDLSNNNLTGSIPSNFSSLPRLQRLSIANNSLSGSIPAALWQSRTLNGSERLILDFENNKLSNISGSDTISLPQNVTLWLQGNPACSNSNLLQFCGLRNEELNNQSSTNSSSACPVQACPSPFVYSPTSPISCFCAVPLIIGYRLKSPGFSDFTPYREMFKGYLTSGLNLKLYQLFLETIQWEEGPRLKMHFQLFPVYDNNTHKFNTSEVLRIMSKFTGWSIPDSDIFGPYELLYFTLLDPYRNVIVPSSKSGISKGALAGVVVAAITGAVALSAIVTFLILRMLVYEFMPNGTLRDHLSAKAKEPLSFAMRVRVALGSAKGILYLHTEADPPIFHRDIKASNILLGSNYTAKVADFGLSRLAPVPDVEGAVPAQVSTVVKGTPGYLDPEYFLTHKLTDKSDVYSLGVVFLELLTGMQPISHGKNIVREVNVSYQSGMIFSVIDERMGSYPSDCVEKFLNLALRCCQDETDARPSMAEVVRELETIWNMMPESDTKTTDSMSTAPEKTETPPSSSSMLVKHPYVSTDVSGSDLVSGVVPTITPR